MTETEKQQIECIHSEQIINPEGFLVCSFCGIMFEEHANLEQGNIFNNHTCFNSTCSLKTTRIGYNREKIVRYKRIYKYSGKLKLDYKDILEIKTYHETKRLLGVLELPNNLEEEIRKKTLFFYSQFQKHTKFRNIHYLTSLALYLTCLERKISVDKNKLLEFSRLDKRLFNKYIYAILKNNKDLMKKLRGNSYRKDLILREISGFIFQKEFHTNFLDFYKKILNIYWDQIKKYCNKTITALIFSLTKDYFKYTLGYNEYVKIRHFTDAKISRFLGIEPSVISHTKTSLIGYFVKKDLNKKEVI